MNSFFFLPNAEIIESRSPEDGQFNMLVDLHKQGVTLDDPSREKNSAILDSLQDEKKMQKINDVTNIDTDECIQSLYKEAQMLEDSIFPSQREKCWLEVLDFSVTMNRLSRLANLVLVA